VRYQWAVATHQGRVRRNNQDSVYPTSSGTGGPPLVVIVADGMGGAAAGEVASRLAVEHAVQIEGSPTDRVLAGNSAILEEVNRRPELAGMGTTVTLADLGNGVATIAHVGDSRAYLWRSDLLRQLTTDHTVVNEYVKAGKLSPEEAESHPQRSMLTRAVGLTPDLDIDVIEQELESGDRLLLCSDGVTSMLDDDQIVEALSNRTAEEAAWELVERANSAGGHDNITALIVDVEDG